MLKRIYFHGTLKSLSQGPIEVNAPSVAEAITAVTRQLPGFRPDPINGYKKISVVGFETVESLFTPTDVIDIHVFPQLNGGKSGGFLQIALGAALVAASFIPGVGQVLGSILLKMGVMMLLGGVLQMFSTPQRDNEDSAKQQSRYLGPPKNTTQIGTRIGILYGRRKIAGHYLSYDIASVDTGL